jgi:polysaccharide biosynthesis protein PslG
VRLPLFAALLAAIAIAALPARAAAAPLPNDFFGVSSPDIDHISEAARAPILADQHAAGVRIVRHTLDWSAVEATKGSFSWDETDSFMTSAARAGMKVLPVVLFSPTWASTCPGAARPGLCPPSNYADLGDFIVAAMQRYGPSGSFWPANPTVPKVPITAWQVWNEPNFPSYWGGAPDAAGYAQMLKTVAPMMRAADPSVEVVTAGMPDSLVSTAIRLVPYVTQLYADGIKGSFDTLAVHGYNETPAGTVGLVEQVRSIMNANGDAAVPIWMTEFGWASAGAPSRFTTDLAGEAANLDAAIGTLVARHEELGMRGLIWYFWHDGSSQMNTSDTWSNHTGIVFQDYTHKPAYDAFRNRAIDTTPPSTSLQSAPTGTVAGGPQTIAFSSSDPGSDFECNLDDTVWAACTSPYPVPNLPAGRHSFEVRATDPYGNRDPGRALAIWTVAAPPPAFRPADVRRDAVSLVAGLRKLGLRRLAARRDLVLPVAWPGAGSVTLTLKTGSKTIGTGSLRLRTAGQGSLRLRLTSSGRTLLGRSRRLRLKLSETFTPSAGSSGPLTATAAMTLKR